MTEDSKMLEQVEKATKAPPLTGYKAHLLAKDKVKLLGEYTWGGRYD